MYAYFPANVGPNGKCLLCIPMLKAYYTPSKRRGSIWLLLPDHQLQIQQKHLLTNWASSQCLQPRWVGVRIIFSLIVSSSPFLFRLKYFIFWEVEIARRIILLIISPLKLKQHRVEIEFYHILAKRCIARGDLEMIYRLCQLTSLGMNRQLPHSENIIEVEAKLIPFYQLLSVEVVVIHRSSPNKRSKNWTSVFLFSSFRPSLNGLGTVPNFCVAIT